jgi:hypothetical protein
VAAAVVLIKEQLENKMTLTKQRKRMEIIKNTIPTNKLCLFTTNKYSNAKYNNNKYGMLKENTPSHMKEQTIDIMTRKKMIKNKP